MKNILAITMFTIGLMTIINAQGITNTLGGNTAAEKFIVENSDAEAGLIVTGEGDVGIGTTDPIAKLHINGDNGAVFIGTLNKGTVPIEGEGTRMMWYPKKAAFRAGYVLGNQWDDANIGWYSSALGCVTIASGIASTALGYHTNAESYASVAVGRFNIGGTTNNFWVETDPLFEIGIGTDDSNRINALTVLKNGNVGIGVANPATELEVAGQIKITGGGPGAGKVLTSDAIGLASWVGGGYSIGDFAQGGHVIEVSSDGNHGIVAALQDQTSSVNWFESNDVCNNAANHNPSGSNYKDWRLPTKRELNILFDQKDAINSTASANGGGTFAVDAFSGQYWSSTAHMDGGAWGQRFMNGVQFFTQGTGTTYRVRAVRVF